MVCQVVAKLKHADSGEFRVRTSLLACAIEFFIDRLADTIGAGSTPSLPEPTVLKRMKYFSILRENRNSHAYTREMTFNEIA